LDGFRALCLEIAAEVIMRLLLSLAGLGLMVSTTAMAQPAPSDPSRDMYCRQDAAARTGYQTPGEAARQAQTNGTVGGLLGGAAIGALAGGRHAGTGAAVGAGVGALAGSAIGSSNAHEAAEDVRRRYADAYYACMNGPGYRPDYSYGAPPPPPEDYPPPPPADYPLPPR
jgi:uncharacterized protein YcfJ